ncbi:MAG: hypothetical protein Kow0059_22590 [Candidatus Sumerlaeia bacterium]
MLNWNINNPPASDEAHTDGSSPLRVLAALHFALGALLLGAIPFLVYWGLHFGRLYLAQLEQPSDLAPPDIFYPAVAVVCLASALFAAFHGGMSLLGGWWLARRRRLSGVYAVAVINALVLPFGTALALATWLTLRSPQTRALFRRD